jgi:excisionase family DNA binding protein
MTSMKSIPHHLSPPTPKDSVIARDSERRLARYVHQNRPLKVHLETEQDQPPIQLPAAAVALLMEILEAMADGQGITIIPQTTELTTVEAANMLNVSRPFLIKLLDKGSIPYRKVGKHRRIRLENLMAYKAQTDHESEAILDQLVSQAQELDMGYGRP